MIVFYLIAALLIAVALLFVLPPLLRKELSADAQHGRNEVNLTVLRDQLRELDADLASGVIDPQGYAVSRQELEKRVLEDVNTAAPVASKSFNQRTTSIAVALMVPVLAIGLYALLGKPAGLDPAQTKAAPPASDPAQNITKEQVIKMVADLAERLKDRPDDVTGWNMLARSYGAMGRYAESAEAFAHLAKIDPNNANTLADYADALGMSLNQTLQGEPEKLIHQALKIDPNNVKAIALLGGANFERKNYPEAIKQWEKILTIVPPESEIVESTQSSIKQARAMLNAPNDVAQQQAPSTAEAAVDVSGAVKNKTASAVSGMVSLAPALRAKVADTDTVFIFARAAQGPRFPLAVLRKQVKDLPISFTLDDSMSMMPEAKLSAFGAVIVGARISKSGSATPSSGDLEGILEPVSPGATGLKIVITTQRP